MKILEIAALHPRAVSKMRGVHISVRNCAPLPRKCDFSRASRLALESVTLFPVHPQPLICVTDVEASSRWYQLLLGLKSNHGGKVYEQLVSDGQIVLQLHSFESDHEHGPIGDPHHKPYGNGVLLWFEVEDFDAAMERAAEMAVEIVLPKHRNPPDPDGGPNHWECWMRDPDGYVVVVASPYGTADGTWRPGK
jgi:catechol 2,3-dioxygenase-like lactoylglutathione lyase family enzyme